MRAREYEEEEVSEHFLAGRGRCTFWTLHIRFSPISLDERNITSARRYIGRGEPIGLSKAFPRTFTTPTDRASDKLKHFYLLCQPQTLGATPAKQSALRIDLRLDIILLRCLPLRSVGLQCPRVTSQHLTILGCHATYPAKPLGHWP